MAHVATTPFSLEPLETRELMSATAFATGHKLDDSHAPAIHLNITPISQSRGHHHGHRARSYSAQLPPGFVSNPSGDLAYYGGYTIPNLQYYNYYVGGNAWSMSDIQNIDYSLAAGMSDPNLSAVVQQYFSTPISTTFNGSSVINGKAPKAMTQAQVETLVGNLYNANPWIGDPSSTVINIMLPPGTRLIMGDGSDSYSGLGGFHGSIHLGWTTVYYAVGVYSQGSNGIPVFRNPWENVVATFYHELNEARTDPDVEDAGNTGGWSSLGWYNNNLGEIGDGAVSQANSLSDVIKEVPLSNGYTCPVQLLWSNQIHGPANF